MTPTEPETRPEPQARGYGGRGAPMLEDRAQPVVELARAGQFDQIRELFTPALRPMVTAAR